MSLSPHRSLLRQEHGPGPAARLPVAVLLGTLLFALPADASSGGLPPVPGPAQGARQPPLRQWQEAFQTQPASPWRLEAGSSQGQRGLDAAAEGCWDLRSLKELDLQIRLQQGQHLAVRLRWALHSRLGGLYLQQEPTPLNASGRPTRLSLSLDPRACHLVPQGHQRPWDPLAAAEVIRLELRAEITGTSRQPVLLHLDNLQVRPFGEEAREEEAQVVDLLLEEAPAWTDAAVVVSFRIEPLPADPFASEGPGDVRVCAGEGEEEPAFLEQDGYPLAAGAEVRFRPAGAPRFKAFLPRKPERFLQILQGTRCYEVRLAELGVASPSARKDLKDFGSSYRSSPWARLLEAPLAVGSGDDPTYALLWRSAPGSWQWDPRSGGWEPLPLPGPGPAWRPTLFWTPRWGDFGGIGRPNFALARLLDERLAQAHTTGRRQPLVLVDQEWFARQGVFNWLSHPLNQAEGGPFAGPGATWQRAEGLRFLERLARYAVARWGRYRAVDSFLINVKVNAPGAPAVHERLGRAARRWPVTASGGRPLRSLHPLAREPGVAKPVGIARGEEGAAGGTWREAETEAARVTLVPRGESGESRPAAGVGAGVAGDGREQGAGEWEAVLEVEALARGGVVSAVKPYRLAAVKYRTVAPDDFSGAEALLFEVWLPAQSPHDLRAGIHLRDGDERWYQALLPGLLSPGDWTTCMLDLGGGNAQQLVPVGHLKPWTAYSRGRIREIGLHVYSTHRERPLRVRFGRVRAVTFAGQAAAPARVLTLLEPAPRQAPLAVGDLWSCSFEVNHAFANPFDLREADLCAVVTTPSGKQVRVPAFFDQPCQRREQVPGGAEVVEAVGPERWTVRYRILEPGPHRVRLELREGARMEVRDARWVRDARFSPEGEPFPPAIRNMDDWLYRYQERDFNGRRRVEDVRYVSGPLTAALELRVPAFEAVTAQAPFKGFVRVDADRRHLCRDDGSFLYPLGPCLRSPSDNRLPYQDRKWAEPLFSRLAARGTYQYDEYFKAFAEHGINWTRIWCCSWWCGLQWRRDWPGYQGLGRYHLLNAWRMDHLLEEASRQGIQVNLCLLNHGQFSYVIDTEWEHNPYNLELGGPLASPSEFFTRAEAKILQLNYLRYVVARWGHAPSVLTWELCSEMEFTDEYRPSISLEQGRPDYQAPHLESWHRQMAAWLQEWDPNRHLVSTHFSHPVHGGTVLKEDCVELAMSNAYSAFEELAGGHKDAAAALHDFWNGSDWNGGVFEGMKVYRKPVLVEEQGRHWMGADRRHGGDNTRENLDADLHAGLWGSLVQPLAGATGYWWWLHLHLDGRYGEYRALARFLEGEDLRARAGSGEAVLEPLQLRVDDPSGRLVARALASNLRAYLWVYDRELPFRMKGLPRVPAASLLLASLRPGRYRVECWDTAAGRLLDAQVLATPAQGLPEIGLRIALPALQGDLAVKVKPVRE